MLILGSPRTRSFNLSDLIIENRKCCWCNVGDIVPPKRRYCSADCSEAAILYCNPQSPTTKAWVLIHLQAGACKYCGLDYQDQLEKRILDRYKYNLRASKYNPVYFKNGCKVSYFQIGDSTGDIWQVDHIVPIYKGGQGVGLDNIQVICTECHKKKTKEDLK